MKLKRPTYTSIVYDYMVGLDDFCTASQIIRETGLDINHVSACIYHLKKYRAIQGMSVEGTVFWFATPEDDTRSHLMLEKAPETRPRKPRKPHKRKKRANVPSI